MAENIGFNVNMGHKVFLVVPVPPTTNSRLKGSERKSDIGKRYTGVRQAKANKLYQLEVRTQLMIQKIKPLSGDLGLKIRWYRKSKTGDVPDRWKDLCDALQSRQRDPLSRRTYDTGSGAYYDDAQIAEFIVRRDDSDPKHPRCEVTLYRLID